MSRIKFLARLSSILIPLGQIFLILLDVSIFLDNILIILLIDVAAIWLSQLILHRDAIERAALGATPGSDVRIVIPDPDGHNVSEVVWATRVGGKRPGYRLTNQPLNSQYEWGEVVQAEPYILSDEARIDIATYRAGNSGHFSLLASIFGKSNKIARSSPSLLTMPPMNPAKGYIDSDATCYNDDYKIDEDEDF